MRHLFLLVLIACTRSEEPTSTPASMSATSAPTPPPSQHPNDVAWTTPKAWTELPNTSAIRRATYGVPKSEGDTAETQVTVTKAGGTVDANVERWKGMFENPGFKRSAMNVSGIQVTFVEIKGTYSDGMNGGPPKPQEMLAAVIETQPELTFFKMVGPEKTVESAKADFLALVQSVHPK